MGKRKKKNKNKAVYENKNQAYRYFQQQNYLGAIKIWRKAVKTEPGLKKHLAEAHFRYALSLDRKTQLETIVSELHLAVELCPKMAIYYFHLGLAYHCQKNYPQAINAYNKALELQPDHSRFKRHLQFALMEQGKSDSDQDKSLALLLQKKYSEILALKNTKDIALHQGFAHAIEGDYGAAKKILKGVPSECQNISDYYLGVIYSKENKFSSAIKSLENAAQNDILKPLALPILLTTYKKQIHQLESEGDHDKAKRLRKNILKWSSDGSTADQAVWDVIADGYENAKKGNLPQAMRLWKRLINQGIDHPALLQNYAIACDHQDKEDLALEFWHKLADVWEKQLKHQKDPETLKLKLSLVYRRIAEIHWEDEDLEEAQEIYEKALAYNPEDLELNLRLINIDMEFAEINYALQKLKKLEKSHPNNLEVLNAMAVCYLEMKNHMKALEISSAVLKLNPKHAHALEFSLDIAWKEISDLYSSGQSKKAKRILHNFIEALPNTPLFYGILAEILLLEKETSQAQEILAQCLAKSQDKDLAHAIIGRVYLRTRDPQKAQDHFSKATESSEKPQVLQQIVVSYLQRNNTKEAEPYLKPLLTSEENVETIIKIVQDLLVEEKTLDVAISILKQAITAFPEETHLRSLLTMICIKIGEFETAEDMIQETEALAKATKDEELAREVFMWRFMLNAVQQELEDEGWFYE